MRELLNRLEHALVEGSLDRPHTCWTKGCKRQATKAVIWADGRAFVPSCAEHLETWKAWAKRQGSGSDGLTAVKPLPSRGESA